MLDIEAADAVELPAAATQNAREDWWQGLPDPLTEEEMLEMDAICIRNTIRNVALFMANAAPPKQS